MEASGLDLSHPVITSCPIGRFGVSTVVALEMIGHAPLALYDGSWTEWGASGRKSPSAEAHLCRAGAAENELRQQVPTWAGSARAPQRATLAREPPLRRTS